MSEILARERVEDARRGRAGVSGAIFLLKLATSREQCAEVTKSSPDLIGGFSSL